MFKWSIPKIDLGRPRQFFRDLFEKIPLIGQLINCPPDARKNAFNEVFVTGLFSTAPFWLTAFISSFIDGYTGEDSFANGEIFILTTAMFGSVIYVASRKYGETKLVFENEEERNRDLTLQFPYSGSFAIISAIACLLCGIVFALLKTKIIAGNPDLKLDTDVIRYWSMGLLVAVLGILYCVAAYKNWMELLSNGSAKQVIGMQRTEENTFAASFAEMVDG